MMATTAFTETFEPFQFRMVSGTSPLYPDVNARRNNGQGGTFWYNDWLASVDTDEAPYVRVEILDQNIKDYAGFCKIAKGRGFNAINMADVIHLLTFDDLEKGNKYAIFSAESPLRQRHKKWARYFRKFIKITHDAGLKFFMYSDEFVYTPEVEAWITQNGLPLGYDNPRLWEVYREKYRELFRNFPEIDGIILRLGEIFVYGAYRGKAIVTLDGSDPEKYHRLVQETYDVVCQECNKLYIQRSWNLYSDGVHSRPDLYHKIFGSIPSKNFMVSIKHTMTDFWYYQPMNPTLGLSGPPQIMEIQGRHEFDGQGVTPCTKVYDIQSRLQRASKMGIAGIYMWPGEGGYDNSMNNAAYETIPYYGKYGFWNEANTYFISEIAQSPGADPRTVLKNWATTKFGRRAADAVADVLMMSDEAAKHVWYMNSYAERTIWFPISMRWFRIQDRGWDTYKPKLENWEFFKRLEDDTVGTTLTRRMIDRFESAEGRFADKKLYQDALGTLKHFDIIGNLLSSWRRAKLFAYQIAAGGSGLTKEQLQTMLDEELASLDKGIPAYKNQYNFWDLREIEASVIYMRAGKTDPDPTPK
ncbi:hypothetical protein [Sorangium sp. So ce128]|uniref:hypothetical protein n=1 Tax=Sorangium sp. So ce128 TaxID=3133281 RepID=UPI003F60C20B